MILELQHIEKSFGEKRYYMIFAYVLKAGELLVCWDAMVLVKQQRFVFSWGYFRLVAEKCL